MGMLFDHVYNGMNDALASGKYSIGATVFETKGFFSNKWRERSVDDTKDHFMRFNPVRVTVKGYGCFVVKRKLLINLTAISNTYR